MASACSSDPAPILPRGRADPGLRLRNSHRRPRNLEVQTRRQQSRAGRTTALIACLQAYHYKDKDVNLKEVVRMLVDAEPIPTRRQQRQDAAHCQFAESRYCAMLIGPRSQRERNALATFHAFTNAGTVELTRFLLNTEQIHSPRTYRGETALDGRSK